jgi:hypothetical protein
VRVDTSTTPLANTRWSTWHDRDTVEDLVACREVVRDREALREADFSSEMVAELDNEVVREELQSTVSVRRLALGLESETEADNAPVGETDADGTEVAVLESVSSCVSEYGL